MTEIEATEQNLPANGDKEQSQPELTKNEEDIIRQIEYYFGDSNLRRDKFLTEQVGKNEGWVPLTTLLTFKRLKSLSDDPKVIVASLEKSTEGLVEISEDKEKLRRHPERPLPEYNEATRKELMGRTAYAKGFPLDSQISDLIEFFKGFEQVKNIVMRKYYDQKDKKYKFKGSVFVTFATMEQCMEFVKKVKIEYKSVGLIRKMQEDYLEMKKKERSKQDKKKAKKAQKEEDKEKEDDDDTQFFLPAGTCLHFTGMTDDKINYNDIKRAMKAVDASKEVAYVDFTPGNDSGKIRFLVENDANGFFDKLTDGKCKIKDVEITFTKFEEEEEKEYLIQSAKNIRTRIKEIHGKKRDHKSRHHNKKRNFDSRKRRADADDNDEAVEKSKDDEPAAKVAKTDEVAAE